MEPKDFDVIKKFQQLENDEAVKYSGKEGAEKKLAETIDTIIRNLQDAKITTGVMGWSKFCRDTVEKMLIKQAIVQGKELGYSSEKVNEMINQKISAAEIPS